MLFETERCLVRRFEEKDIDDFMAYRNDLCWMKHQGFKGLTRPEYQNELLGGFSPEKGAQLAVVRKSDGRLIGDLYAKREAGLFWIGYTIGPSNARQGYASEAVGGLIRWIRAQGPFEIRASVEPQNLPSVCLLEKLGFFCAGTDENGELSYALNPDS